MEIKVGGLYWVRDRVDIVLMTIYDDPHKTRYPFRGQFKKIHNVDGWTAFGQFSPYLSYKHAYDLVEEVTDPVLLAFYQK